jgi:hypothetical protein
MSAAARPSLLPAESGGSAAPLWTIVVTVVLAAIGWTFMLGSRLSAVETEAVQARERLQRVEREAGEARGYLQSIDQRLARIEGKLESRR